jgi:hypothetical protein
MEKVNLCDNSPWLAAMGFWSDAGVSSHTARSLHAHERAIAQNNSCIAWHDFWGGIVFTHGPSPWNPYDIYLYTCKRTPESFFSTDTKVEMGATMRRGFHPPGSSQGPFAAKGKDRRNCGPLV